ncbi:hypothetical protein A3F52_03545 [Candidatus Uhrbacteria bacterium RIFCSPHIGHO2_12_FULL_47_11]|nr:MAG: hypothetical protein A3F52_03545 [Candidatus Uhrbacteria bacterium RIFCSPHIGHO2_12_FULL_47_11]
MKFYYKARTQTGEIQTGNVEATNRTAALEVLHRHNLVVIGIKERDQASLLNKDLAIFSGVRGRDIVVFSRSLSSLFDAGVPLVEAIRVVAEQVENAYLKKSLFEVATDVDGGVSFSRALSQHPNIFSTFYVNMVKTGEVSGNLQKTLSYLADYLESEFNLKSKIKSALTYPIFIVFVFIIVGLIMLLFVIPNLGKVLQQISPDKLPAITKGLFAVSDFVREWWWIIIFGLIGLVAAAIFYIRTPDGRQMWHDLQLRVPVFGPLLKKIYQARFANNLSTLIRGGLPIIQSLKISGDVVGNLTYTRIVNEVADQVKTGATIESVLKKYPTHFSTLATQMVAVGEKSGKLEGILQKVAAFYEQDINRTVENLTALIEPIMIIVLGIGVAIVVASIIIPMYSVITSISS